MATPGSVRSSRSSLNNSLRQQSYQKHWIERHFFKRECSLFVTANRGGNKCACGRTLSRHNFPRNIAESQSGEKWQIHKHTDLSPTNAFGTLEFQGGTHPLKAQYVRLAHDTIPEHVLQLFLANWNLELPKLLISVHGGISNFELQPKLKRVFRKGFLKAAATTSAWVITGGTNTGVMRHVGDALGERSAKAKNNIITIGIAPWGIVHNREDLIGKDVVRPYHAISSPKSNSAVLNSHHSYFLLVDNGTVGKYGGEIELRKQLEKFISQQKLSSRNSTKGHVVPVVCVVLEGGTNTIRTVLQYVTDTPPVPVVVCDGSGRAADLLAFTHKYALDDGTMQESLKNQLVVTIEKTFQYTREQAEKLFIELMLCVKKKELITIFRMGEGGGQDIDLAILTALLKGQNASPADQLSLALTWNRVDIARSHIFLYGQEWPKQTLEMAMMDALVNDRTDFVKLLMENGVSMQNFLTIQRLEELYNTKAGPSNTLRYLVRDVRKNMPQNYQYTLIDIGLVIEQLMGGAFRANYCRRKFRALYYAVTKKPNTTLLHSHSQGHNISNFITEVPVGPHGEGSLTGQVFCYPFHDLMVWAVLMKRQKMALFMWQLGEEALSKSLVACCLNKAMAKEAADDDLEIDVSEALMSYALDFQKRALDLLDSCYQQDDDYTEQLLTYELKNWSNQTCLSLAVAAGHREFLAHTCCQMLLSDMWLGGMRMRKHSSFKVILGILIPPTILALEFKSKEELQLMPQTVEEHIQEIETDSESDDSSVGSQEDMEEYFDSPEVHFSPSSIPYHPQDNGGLVSSTSFNTTLSTHKKSSPLKIGKKIYEFYAAPITKFWLHALMYIAFVVVYTYVVLVKMEPGLSPSSAEVFVISYIFTMIIEKVREIIASEPVKFPQKLAVFFSDGWNILDTIATLTFAVGVVLRIQADTDVHVVGRIFYCVNIMFWYIRLLDLFAVSKHLGPYVTMVGKMVMDMISFLIILLIVLMSFGVARQAILFPNEGPSWHLVRDVFLEPYFMLYGEVYAGTIDRCGGEDTSGCTPGAWITPIIMSIYLLVANILLINLLIAVFNVTFQKVKPIAKQLWKFQRYSLTIEYEQKPLLPPPLILFSHMFLIVKYIIRRCKGLLETYDNGLKLFLCDEDVEKLHDFEEDCVEEYFRCKDSVEQSSMEQRIRLTTERVENMGMRMEDMHQKENQIKLSLQTVDYRLAKLEDLALHTASTLDIIQQCMTTQFGMKSPERSPITSPTGVAEEVHSDDLELEGSHVFVPDQNLSSVATPMVKHSRKPLETGQMELYTDKSTPDDVDSTMQLDTREKVEEEHETSIESPSDILSDLKSVRDPPVEGSLLKRRAIGKTLPPLSIGGSALPAPQETGERRVSFAIFPIKQDMTDTISEPAKYTSARLDDSIVVSTVQPGQAQVSERPSSDKPGSRRARTRTYSGDVLPRTSSLTSNQSSNSFVPPASVSLSSSMTGGSSAIAATLFPFVVGEYTTITDNIDTSCIVPDSPGASPTTPRNQFFAEDRLESPERDALINEARVLKDAEETEKLQMEVVIRHRLRQISIDESDNLSDIARFAMAEMEIAEHSTSEESSHSEINFSVSVVDETGDKVPEQTVGAKEDQESHEATEMETKF